MSKQNVKILGISRKDEHEVMEKQLKPVANLFGVLEKEMNRKGYHFKATIKYRPMEWSREVGYSTTEE